MIGFRRHVVVRYVSIANHGLSPKRGSSMGNRQCEGSAHYQGLLRFLNNRQQTPVAYGAQAQKLT